MTKWLWLAGVAILALPACDQVAIDKADASPPTIQIKVKGADGQYAVASSATLFPDPVDVMAVAEDTGGVHTISLKILGRTSDSCTVGSTVYSGTYTVNGLPKDQDVTLTEKDGKAPTKFPLLATLPKDVTCTVSAGKVGHPIGHTLTVRATATNWGTAAAATADLAVKVE